MAQCVSCGEELHPERAEKYDYCTKRECWERNNKGLAIVAVGVNKAGDQYVVLDEYTRQEMASGRHNNHPETPGSSHGRWRSQPVHTPRPTPVIVPRSSAVALRPRWSEGQENLALVYRAMGMKPDEIAKKLGVSRYLVTQILLAAKSQVNS